jgi:excisionase family DNA binding protein
MRIVTLRGIWVRLTATKGTAMDSAALLVSKREAAKALSISLRKLEQLISSEELPVRRIGRRVLVARRSLEKFADASQAVK